jgi:hypothetical protein
VAVRPRTVNRFAESGGKATGGGAAEDRQFGAVALGRAVEVGERDEVEVLLEGSEAGRVREAGVTGAAELPTDRIDRVEGDAQRLGHPTAKTSQFSIGRAPDGRACLPAAPGLAIDLTAVIPQEVYRPRLQAKCPAGRSACVLDALSLGQEHAFPYLVCVTMQDVRPERERPDIASRYRDGVLWSPAEFAASTGGAILDVVKQYVEPQRQRVSSSPWKGEACAR